MRTCKYCGRIDTDDADDYYHKKSCEAKDLQERINNTTDPEEIKKLKKWLEQARYVGD